MTRKSLRDYINLIKTAERGVPLPEYHNES